MAESSNPDTASSAPLVLRLDHVSKHFGPAETGAQAVRDVSLTVAAGEVVAVMGPSGSGKSTLVQIACGLVVPDAGMVSIDGERVGTSARRRAELRRRRIGVVFQRLNLVPGLSALENVMAPLLLDGSRVTSARPAAMAAMTELGIDALADLAPAQLSGGQEQMVAIARAIVGHRGLLLADEPTGALDSATSDAVIRLLVARAAAGAAVVVVTHDAAVASWADRVVMVRDGAVVGRPDGASATSPNTRAKGRSGVVR